MEDENAKLKQYLLGNLATPEIEAFDLQLIADESLEEKLCWAESELTEDYLDETLSPAEVALFQTNFLASPERAAQVRQISLLRNYARSSSAAYGAADEICGKSPETFYERLKRFFSLNLRPATVVFALVIVGLIIGTIVYRSAYQPTPLDREFAELNRKDLSSLSEFENLTKLNLSFGSYRDSGGAASKLPESRLTDTVLLRLALPFAANQADKFKVEIIKDKKIILSRDGTPFYNNPNGSELRLLLPSSVLKRGEYQIKVQRETANESAVNYSFTVQ